MATKKTKKLKKFMVTVTFTYTANVEAASEDEAQDKVAFLEETGVIPDDRRYEYLAGSMEFIGTDGGKD